MNNKRGLFDIQAANCAHNNKYDYSRVRYQGADVKVEIICPIHGSFWQKSYLHILRKNGCPKCKGVRISKSKHVGFEHYVEQARKTHGNRYDYPPQTITNIFDKINIVCRSHGIFSQNFNNHIHNKNGCPQCGYNVSVLERAWLDTLNVPSLERQKVIWVGKKKYKVDGYDPSTNTIYEFFGVFWHGHPDHFTGINELTGKPFKHYYELTLKKIAHLRFAGYNLIEKWG